MGKTKSKSKPSKAKIPRGPVYRPEDKYYTTNNLGPDTIDWLGKTYPLTVGIPLGDKNDERDGMKIDARSLKLRMYFDKAISGGPSTIRMVVFQDRDNRRGAEPSPAQLFQADPVASTGLLAPMADFNRLNKSRFKILKDSLITLTDTIPSKHKTVTLSIKSKNVLTWSPITGNENEGGNNHIYVIFISSSNGSDFENQDTVRFISRLKYYDS